MTDTALGAGAAAPSGNYANLDTGVVVYYDNVTETATPTVDIFSQPGCDWYVPGRMCGTCDYVPSRYYWQMESTQFT